MPTAITKTKRKTVKPERSAMAIHDTDGENHVVGIGDLRVILCNDDGIWFAQGLEIDYAADGTSKSEAQENFEHGLRSTVILHLEEYGNIEKLLIPAPAEIWKELWAIGKHHRFSQVTFLEVPDESSALGRLPFRGINYIEQPDEVAA